MRTIINAGIIVVLLSASPVFAESHPHKRAATITRWALIGAGAGFGIGLVQGMRADDDATYAEQKIRRAAWLSALAGGVIGAVIGASRSNPARTSNESARPDASSSKSTWATCGSGITDLDAHALLNALSGPPRRAHLTSQCKARSTSLQWPVKIVRASSSCRGPST